MEIDKIPNCKTFKTTKCVVNGILNWKGRKVGVLRKN
jgi:hypothetical protein